jgi:hypothetical protein
MPNHYLFAVERLEVLLPVREHGVHVRLVLRGQLQRPGTNAKRSESGTRWSKARQNAPLPSEERDVELDGAPNERPSTEGLLLMYWMYCSLSTSLIAASATSAVSRSSPFSAIAARHAHRTSS